MQIHQQRAERPNLERLVHRISAHGGQVDDEIAIIRSLWRSARHIPANTVLTGENEPQLITSGWAGWLRYDDTGRRQIFLFLMPGDFIIPGLFRLECCDLVSLTPLRTVNAAPLCWPNAPATSITGGVIASCGGYYRLLLLDHLTRLTAGCTTRSVAHLLGELHIRSVRSGACHEGRFSFPIGQRILASALGRSTVQINKIIHQLQHKGLLAVGYDWIELRDPEKLRELGGMTHSLLTPSRALAGLAMQGDPTCVAVTNA
jgi:hypothetical protein